MNLLFLSTRLNYPPVGGHSQRTFNIIRYLSDRHNIFYVAFNRKNASDEENRRYRQEMLKYCCECHTFDISSEHSKIIFFANLFRSLLTSKPFISYKYKTSQFSDCIKDIISRNRIDYIHFDMLPLTEYKKIAGSRAAILTEHNVEYLRYFRWLPYEKNSLMKIFICLQYLKLKKYEHKRIKEFEKCIVMSENDKKILSEANNTTSFIVIPNGTDTNYFRPEAKSRLNGLVWAGGMTMWPNKDAVTYFTDEIFPLILKKRPETVFNVIGKSPAPALKKSPHSKNIITHGFVEDIRPIVANAAVYVAPIRIGSGTKLKILDAMAMAKAVVTTSIGAEGINVTDGRNIFICDEPEIFAARTVQLLNDRKLNKKLSENARKFVEENYSWEVILPKMESVYG